MKSQGKLTTWNDDRGFGFITPQQGGERIFVHIKAFADRAHRPVVGDVIAYAPATDSKGRPRAQRASIASKAKAGRSPRRSLLPYLVAILFLTLVAALTFAAALPTSVLAIYLLSSLLTLAAYALDKKAAKADAQRTPEARLHLLALIGGWPGALIAQQALRHKTRKQPFRKVFWITVLINGGALVWLMTPQGKEAWRVHLQPIEQSLARQWHALDR